MVRSYREPIAQAMHNLLYTYRYDADRRGLEFELTMGEFISLTSGDCYYCGSLPSQVKYTDTRNPRDDRCYIYNGIDRLSNDIGYVTENCVSCCGICNAMKKSLGHDQFLRHIQRIYAHRFSPAIKKSAGMLCDDLITTNIKCFMAQDDIFRAKEVGDNDLVADLAVKATRLNSRRNELMRAIDEMLGSDYSVTEKTYDGK